jgi:hypothetical protein
MDVFQLVTVILVVHWMMEHVTHAQMWQMVWSQVVVIAKQMLMAVVVIGARMDSGTLMRRILKVVNVSINSRLIIFYNPILFEICTSTFSKLCKNISSVQ